MKRRVSPHIIGNIIVCIIGILNCYLFEEFNLLNVLKSVLKVLIYYWAIMGAAYLIRKLLK
mgnify:CR=1 FL=1